MVAVPFKAIGSDKLLLDIANGGASRTRCGSSRCEPLPGSQLLACGLSVNGFAGREVVFGPVSDNSVAGEPTADGVSLNGGVEEWRTGRGVAVVDDPFLRSTNVGDPATGDVMAVSPLTFSRTTEPASDVASKSRTQEPLDAVSEPSLSLFSSSISLQALASSSSNSSVHSASETIASGFGGGDGRVVGILNQLSARSTPVALLLIHDDNAQSGTVLAASTLEQRRVCDSGTRLSSFHRRGSRCLSGIGQHHSITSMGDRCISYTPGMSCV